MISTFEIAALFSIEDGATEPLAAIAAGMERVSELAAEARASLQSMASVTFGAVSGAIDSLAGSIGNLNRAASEAAKATEGVAGAAAASAAGAVSEIDKIAAAYGRARDAEERYRAAASRPYEGAGGAGPMPYGRGIEGPYLEGEIGGTGMTPYRSFGAAPYRRAPGPVIDGSLAPEEALALGYAGVPRLGYDGGAADSAGSLAVMPRGFGRGNPRGTESPYQGGFRNPYTGPESGPAINLGYGEAPRPHDESLDIPPTPYGSPPGGGKGGSGGGGRGGRGSRREEDGVIHFGLAELAADWAVGDAFKTAAEEENAIARTEIGLQLDPASPQGRLIAQQLRDTYRRAALNTQFSEKNTAVAGAIYARELGFTAAEGGVGKFQQSFPVALRSAEIAEQEGLGSLDSSLTAALEYAHMTGNYEPKQLDHSLNVLQQVATLTDNTMGAEESILKYSVPVGRAAGMDPDKVAEMTGFLQQSGFNSSTAGTGLSHLFLGVLQSGGGINAHLEKGRANAEKELIGALHLSPSEAEAARKESKGSAHVEAARELGLTDANGNITILDSKGGLDGDALFKRISDYGGSHTPEQTLKTLHDAFGLQGQRVAGVIAEKGALEREGRFSSNVEAGARDFGAQRVQDMLSQTTEQRFGQTMARLADAANNAVTPLLGLANAALNGTIGLLNLLTHEEQEHPFVAGTAGALATAGAAYATFRGGKGVWSFVKGLGSRLLGGGAAEGTLAAAPELAVGAGAVGGAGLMAAAGEAILPVLAGLAVGGAALKGVDHFVGKVGTQDAVRDEHSGIGKLIYDNFSGLRYLDNWLHGTGGARSGTQGPSGRAESSPASQSPGPSAAGGASFHITVGPITLNGVGNDIRPMVEKLFHEMADKLGQSLTHASTVGYGHMSSAFSTGGAP